MWPAGLAEGRLWESPIFPAFSVLFCCCCCSVNFNTHNSSHKQNKRFQNGKGSSIDSTYMKLHLVYCQALSVSKCMRMKISAISLANLYLNFRVLDIHCYFINMQGLGDYFSKISLLSKIFTILSLISHASVDLCPGCPNSHRAS